MIRKANSKGKIVKAPGVVHKYNEPMGGVDRWSAYVTVRTSVSEHQVLRENFLQFPYDGRR